MDVRHAAHLRLDAEDAAERRRDANRAAAVAAQRDRAEARRDGRRRAAARSARRARQIPGIVRGSEDAVLGHRDEAELRRVRLAEVYAARIDQPLRADLPVPSAM